MRRAPLASADENHQRVLRFVFCLIIFEADGESLPSAFCMPKTTR